jgi:hypothetical protein
MHPWATTDKCCFTVIGGCVLYNEVTTCDRLASFQVKTYHLSSRQKLHGFVSFKNSTSIILHGPDSPKIKEKKSE